MTRADAHEAVSENLNGMIVQLQLQGWDIKVEYPELEQGAPGSVNVNAAYERAVIGLDPKQHDTQADLLRTLRHELLHIVCWPMHDFADWAEEQLDGFDQGESQVWRFHIERQVLNLERLLDMHQVPLVA